VSPNDVLAGALVVLGGALALVAGVGVLRLPDVFARMHAATKPATLGLVLLVLGAALQMDSAADDATLALVVALQFLTAPAGAHLVGRAAARAGVGRGSLVVDDLEPPT
jgi:multicomponent Na+:H+ antiporter subunit G